MTNIRKEVTLSMKWNDYKMIAYDIRRQFLKWLEDDDIKIEGLNIFRKKVILSKEELEGMFLALIHNGMGI